MSIFKPRKQGEIVPNGFSYVTDDENAHINMLLIVCLPYSKKVREYFEWSEDWWYYHAILGLEISFYLRIRKWSFVKEWPGASFFGCVRKLFIMDIGKRFKLKSYVARQTSEDKQEGVSLTESIT